MSGLRLKEGANDKINSHRIQQYESFNSNNVNFAVNQYGNQAAVGPGRMRESSSGALVGKNIAGIG